MVTDYIKIYSIFGVFIAGAAVSRGEFSYQIGVKIEYLTNAFLFHIFFSCLNTQIDPLNFLEIGLVTLIIIFSEILGKGASCTLSEKIQSESWRNTFRHWRFNKFKRPPGINSF